MSGDISDKTIIVLFIVTLLVSSVGTFMVVKSINEAQIERNGQVYGKVNGAGGVELNIEKPAGSGSVKLEILDSKN
jgi:hypothetical protein